MHNANLSTSIVSYLFINMNRSNSAVYFTAKLRIEIIHSDR